MATAYIPATTAGVTLTPAQLSAAREALVARIDAACDRAMRLGLDMPGMPSGLISASCFLADRSVIAPACRGETFFGWDIATSRRYLDGLDPASRATELELGERILFTGRRPICAGVLDTARALADAADRLTKLRADHLAAADALRQRWNANAARRNAQLGREAA